MGDLVSPVPQFAQEEVKRVYTTHYTEVAYDRVRDCVELPFNVSDQDLADLHEAFPGAVFKPDTTQPQRLHPVAAVGLLLTQSALEAKVQGKSYIEVGAAFANVPPKHSCYRIDGRDEQRVIKAKISTPVSGADNAAKREYLNKVLEGSKDSRYCRKGFHKCDVKAEVAIANHVYDITADEVAEGFQRHCLDAMYVGLILPTEALYGISRWNSTFKYGFQARDKKYNQFLDEHHEPQTGFFKNIKRRLFGSDSRLVTAINKQVSPVAYTEEDFENQYYTMYFKDPSLVYTHKRKTWNFWMTSNTFTARGMNFVVERYRTIGPVTIVLITRATMGAVAESPVTAPVTDEVPLLDISKCYKTLLTQFNSFRASGRAKQIIAMMPHVLVPKDLHAKVMVYALAREDGNFTRHHIVSYVRAISQRITIGGTHVQSGFTMDAEEYEAVCIALFIEANVRRQATTKVVGELIRNISTSATFLEKCINTITSWFEDINCADEFQFMPSATAKKIAKLFTAKLIAMQLVAEVTTDLPLAPTHRHEQNSFLAPITYGPNALEESVATLEYGHPKSLVPQGLLPALVEKHSVSLVHTEDHVQPMIHKDEYCRHGLAYKPQNDYCDNAFYTGARFAYDEFAADDYVVYEDNIPKTAWKLAHFIEVFKPYRTHVVASEPGNDLSLFPLNNIEAIYHEGPPREDSRAADICRQFGIQKGMKVNVACVHCARQFKKGEAVYCDVGSDGTDEQLVALQIAVISALKPTKAYFVVKLQRYFKTIAYPTRGTGTLANLMHDYLVFQVPSPNANEAYVTNMCTAGTDCTNINKYGLKFNHQIPSPVPDYDDALTEHAPRSPRCRDAQIFPLPSAPPLEYLSDDLVVPPRARAPPRQQPSNPMFGHTKDQRPYERRKRNRNRSPCTSTATSTTATPSSGRSRASSCSTASSRSRTPSPAESAHSSHRSLSPIRPVRPAPAPPLTKKPVRPAPPPPQKMAAPVMRRFVKRPSVAPPPPPAPTPLRPPRGIKTFKLNKPQTVVPDQPALTPPVRKTPPPRPPPPVFATHSAPAVDKPVIVVEPEETPVSAACTEDVKRHGMQNSIPDQCDREVPWTAPKWTKCIPSKTEGKPLRFKSRKQEGEFLSNFYRVSIKGKCGGRKFDFRNTEGFYQYYKNTDVLSYFEARNPNPFKIKEAASKSMCCHQHGIAVMARALEFKFAHPELQKQLLATGKRPLIEDTKDKFWGGQQGAEGWLGTLLMLLRSHLRGEQLQQQEAPKPAVVKPTTAPCKYIQEAEVDLNVVVQKSPVVLLGIRSAETTPLTSADMPNAYHLPRSARTTFSIDGNLVTLWSILNGGRQDRLDSQEARLKRTEKMLKAYIQVHKPASFHVPATMGCSGLGGDLDEWHAMLTGIANKYQVYITKAIRPKSAPKLAPKDKVVNPPNYQVIHVAGELPFKQYTSNLFPTHRRVDVKGDGNCLPRAIAHVVYGKEERYQEFLKGYERNKEDIETNYYGEALISHVALNFGLTIAVVREGKLTFVYGEEGIVVPLHLHHAHYNALVPAEPDYYYDEDTAIMLSHEGVPKPLVEETFGIVTPEKHYHADCSFAGGNVKRAGGIYRTTDDSTIIADVARKALTRFGSVLFPGSGQRSFINSQKMTIIQNIACVLEKHARFYDDTRFCTNCAACQTLSTYPLIGAKVTGNTVDTSNFKAPVLKPSTAKIELSDKKVRTLLVALRRELAGGKNDKAEFIELNRTASQNIDKLMKSKNDLSINTTVEGFTGVPGSGKTYTITQNYNNQGFDVVVPFRRLLDEYRQAGFKGKTHVAGVDGKHRDRVILDEVFALSPGLFVYYLCTSGKIVVIGDPCQMYNVDELNVYKDVHVRDLFDHSKLTMLNHSFTVPHDICAYLNSTVYKDRPFTTSSPVLNSVQYITAGGTPPGKLVYSFTTNYALRQGAVTVASIQGMRQKETHLMVESNSVMILRKIPEQVVVALSRHTEKIFIHLSVDNLKAFMDVKPLVMSEHTCLAGGFKQFEQQGITTIYTGVEFGPAPEQEDDEEIMPHFTRPRPETQRKERARNKMAKRLGVDSIKVQVQNVTETHGDVLAARTAYVQIPAATLASVEAAGLNLVSDGFTINDATDLPAALEYDRPPHEEVDHCVVRNVSIPMVEDILNSISPSTSEPEAIFYGYDHTEFEKGTGKLTIYPSITDSTIELGDKTNRVFKKLPLRLRGRPCDFRNKSQQLHCMIRRYGNIKHPHQGLTPNQAAEDLFRGFKRMCRTENFPQITDELVSLCFAEQMLKIKMKGDVYQAAEYDIFLREYSSKITCFLKNQTKKDLSDDAWLKPDKGDIKAGQGISAQPKMVNIMVGALVRAVSKLVSSALKPEIVLGTGIDPVNLSLLIKNMNLGDDPMGIEIDVSEFDSQRGEWTDIFMDKVYSAFGIDPKRLAYMTELNKLWTLDAGDLKQSVVGHFQSGRADTLLSNTLVSVAFFGAFFQEKNLRLGLFQGDDVCLIADNVEQKVDKSFLKVQLTHMPTFCGYMVRNGLTIDIPAMSAKLSNRLFHDSASIESYRLGVADWMRTVRGTADLYNAIHCAAYKYGSSFEEVAYLQGFLNDFAAGRLVPDFNSKHLVQIRAHGVPVTR